MNKIISIFPFLSLLFVSCVTKKQIIENSVNKSDTSHLFHQSKTQSVKESFEKLTIKDTTIKIEARSLEHTFNIEPVYNVEGKEILVEKEVARKGVSIKMEKLPNNQVRVTAICDSLEKLVPGLIEISERRGEEVDSLNSIIADYLSVEQSELEHKIQNSNMPSWVWIILVTGLLVLVFVVWGALKLKPLLKLV